MAHGNQKPRYSVDVLQMCPVCRAPYGEQAGRLLEANVGARFLHLTCATCSHMVLACVLETAAGKSSFGMLTDLSFDDAVRIRKKGPLQADEILALHDYLTKHHHIDL